VKLTPFPFQRVGAHAAAAIAGKPTPYALTPADLDAVVQVLVGDCAAAAAAPKDGPGYAWWKVLFACFPNSPATHAARARWGDAGIRDRLEALFTPDTEVTGPCDMCGEPAAQRWGKGLRPLAASARYVNDGPVRPLCRECRICMWTLPYGSASNGKLIVTAESGGTGTSDCEAAVARRCTTLNREAIAARLADWPPGNWYLDPAWDGLQEHPGDLTLLRWRDDNKEPWLETWVITAGRARQLADSGFHPLAVAARDADAIPNGLPLSKQEARNWLWKYEQRDRMVLDALDAGLTRTEIHNGSGLSRVTINKIIAGAYGETAVEKFAT
jgi:CRISPR-associated protein Cst1